MAKKPIDPVVSIAGSFQSTAQLLAAALTKRGGNLAEAVMLLAKPAYSDKLDALADILATVREEPKLAQDVAEKAAIAAKKRAVIEPWVVFYTNHFPQEFAAAGGAEVLYAITLPPAREGLPCLLVVLEGLTMNRLYAEITKQGYPCWRYAGDLDGSIPKNDRVPNKSYALWHRGRDEADEELKDLSANDLALRQIKTMGVIEYEVFKLKHFEDTTRHLDVINITLLAGSRNADGYVPFAHWHVGTFRVHWTLPRYSHPNLRSREVVSD